MGLLTNVTAINMAQIMNIGNSSSFPEFLIKVNNTVFGGWWWFVILFVTWIILFVAMNKSRDQLLNNLMYSGAIVTVVSFFLRGMNMAINGVVQGLLTDHQMWVFPVFTLIFALIVWASKET
jgi:hypothetical protein